MGSISDCGAKRRGLACQLRDGHPGEHEDDRASHVDYWWTDDTATEIRSKGGRLIAQLCPSAVLDARLSPIQCAVIGEHEIHVAMGVGGERYSWRYGPPGFGQPDWVERPPLAVQPAQLLDQLRERVKKLDQLVEADVLAGLGQDVNPDTPEAVNHDRWPARGEIRSAKVVLALRQMQYQLAALQLLLDGVR